MEEKRCPLSKFRMKSAQGGSSASAVGKGGRRRRRVSVCPALLRPRFCFGGEEGRQRGVQRGVAWSLLQTYREEKGRGKRKSEREREREREREMRLR